MPQVSHRSETVPLSPIRKLIPFADEAKKRGVKVYHLNIGQPDILTHPKAVAQFRKKEWDVLEYSPSNGVATYRQALVGYFARFGINLTLNNIMVTTGGSEAILFFMLSCLDPGDEIIIPEPFYANYNGYAHIADVRVVPITSHIEDGFSLPSPEAFANKITRRTKAIMITSPNNPTGACYTNAELDQLAGIVKKHDLYLCADEVYREFTYASDNSIKSILQLPGLENNAIVIDSVSKRYSATGARVGMLVSKNLEVLTCVDRFATLRLSPPSLGQMLSECLLENDKSYLTEVKKEYRLRRDTVYKRLNQMPGVFTYEPGGAFYCFARLPISNSEDFCQWLLSEYSYNGATVMLAPGPGFYATPGLGRDECRIAYVLNVDELERAMDCLENALGVYTKKMNQVSLSV